MYNQEQFRREAGAIIAQTAQLREEAMLSQQQVATLLGLSSHGSINAIETGKTVPRLDTLLRLLSVYGYTLQLVPKTEE